MAHIAQPHENDVILNLKEVQAGSFSYSWVQDMALIV